MRFTRCAGGAILSHLSTWFLLPSRDKQTSRSCQKDPHGGGVKWARRHDVNIGVVSVLAVELPARVVPLRVDRPPARCSPDMPQSRAAMHKRVLVMATATAGCNMLEHCL